MKTTYDLNGLWDYEPLAWVILQSDGSERIVEQPLPEKGTMQIPGNWHYSGLPDFYGKVHFTRRFDVPPADGNRCMVLSE